MLQLCCLDTVRITKVKGHVEEGMVLDGRVREQDRVGNNAADEAADLAVGGLTITLLMLGALCLELAVDGILSFLNLYRFFVATSRLWLITMGGDGTAPDPLVWSAGALPKKA